MKQDLPATALGTTVAFVVTGFTSHLNATFVIARDLAARGHRIVFIGDDRVAEWSRRHGFSYVEGTFLRPLSISRARKQSLLETARGLSAQYTYAR